MTPGNEVEPRLATDTRVCMFCGVQSWVNPWSETVVAFKRERAGARRPREGSLRSSLLELGVRQETRTITIDRIAFPMFFVHS